MINTIEYTLPEFMTCYLFYGDNSNLTDGEQALIDSFLEREGLSSPLSVTEEPFFTRYHDFSRSKS